jgi:hypothetical protein
MSETPLTDFIASLADPTILERFRANPAGTAAAAGLSAELANLVIIGHPGVLRVRGIKELERAGLAPLVSDKFARGCEVHMSSGGAQPPGHIPDAKKKTLPSRPTVFPITSHEDLVNKISRLLLTAPFADEAAPGPGLPAGHKPPYGAKVKSTEEE